jgi:hypothetical protein
MKIFVSGNGNTSFEDFLQYYAAPISQILEKEADAQFLVGEFRGTDILTLEFLKTKTALVQVFHVGSAPRYFPDKFKTYAQNWQLVGGFTSDASRDAAAIEACTHFIATDFNSDEKRTSGTLKNIQKCLKLGKIRLDAAYFVSQK